MLAHLTLPSSASMPLGKSKRRTKSKVAEKPTRKSQAKSSKSGCKRKGTCTPKSNPKREKRGKRLTAAEKAAAEKAKWDATLQPPKSVCEDLIGTQPELYVDKDNEQQPYCRFYKDEGGKNKQNWAFEVCPVEGEHTFYAGGFLRCPNPECKCDPREGGGLVSKSACQLLQCTSVSGISDPYFVNSPENAGWKSHGFTICAAESGLTSFFVHCKFTTVSSGMRCTGCNGATKYQILLESNLGRAAYTRAVEVRSKRKIPHYLRDLSAKEIAEYHQKQKSSSPNSPKPSTLAQLQARQERFEVEVRKKLRDKDKRIGQLEIAVRQLQKALDDNAARHYAIYSEIQRLQSILTQNNTVPQRAQDDETNVLEVHPDENLEEDFFDLPPEDYLYYEAL